MALDKMMRTIIISGLMARKNSFNEALSKRTSGASFAHGLVKGASV
jgi:hypothetical protein